MSDHGERAKELAAHVRFYCNFIFALRLIIAITALILILLAYFLL